MRSLLITLMLGCVLCACSPDFETQEAEDAGSLHTPSDAGHDASFDAGVADAGHDGSFDAGVADAGHEESFDAGDEETSPDAGQPLPRALAPGVSVRHLALFQAVKVPLATDRVQASGARPSIVSGRDAVVRAWVEGPLAGHLGLLDVSAGDTYATIESSPPQMFPDTPGLQALTFHVPAALVQPDTRYRVQVVSPSGEDVGPGQPHDARYPADGSDLPLQAQAEPGALKVVLVPVQYDTDGSHRLPDTSPEQLERMRSLLHALYPATEVELVVRAPMAWNVGLKLTNNLELGTLNSRLADLRASDGAPFDVYYYGLISPAETLSAHCGRVRWPVSCTTGQSWPVSDPSDEDIRVGSGMGFSGDDSVWTLIHELGHMHGRAHAPCGISGDKNYPYSNALIGTWGYDATTDTLVDPATSKDFMSYCDPAWVSDYTWKALYERISAVNALAFRAAPVRVPTFVVQVEEGEASKALRLGALSARVGQPGVEVSLLAADGHVLDTVASRLAAHSHGGVSLFVPAPQTPVAALAFTLDGVVYRVPVAPW